MKIQRVVLLTLSLVGTVAGSASAQDMEGRRASLFDLGIYAGGAYTTNWFSEGEDFSDPGIALRGGVESATSESGIELRGEVGFARLFGENVDFNIFSGTVGATYPIFGDHYVGAGAGLFRLRATCDGCPAQTDPGLQIFVGGTLVPDFIRLEAGTDIFGDVRLLKVGVVLDVM